MADATDPHASEGGGLKRSLSLWGLIALGIGAIVGAGIFSLTGQAAAHFAGPGIVYSFLIGGFLCALAGLCYAEMAAMIPVSGSAYAYSYATMGEFIAWIIGWDLILEYAFGAVAVSVAWSGYVLSLLHKTLHLPIPDILWRLSKGPWETVTLSNGSVVEGLWNVPASIVVLLMASVLFRGIKESAVINTIVVIVKVLIVLLFIALGIGVISSANLAANPGAGTFSQLVPPKETLVEAGREVTRFGWGLNGVLTGAGVVFFAYIGFDALSTTAQEAKNPKRDLPLGILISLVVCTLLYVLVALVLTGVVNYRQLGVPDPIAVGIDRIVQLRHWSPFAGGLFTFFVKIGAIAGLTSVILVNMLGQTRVFYAMSKDGLLPWFSRLHPRHQTPATATILTGLFVAVAGGILPMSVVGELVSVGTLLAFVLVCIGVPILRVTNPEAERPFRVPMPWVVGILGAVSCLWVMWSLPADTWLRLFAWLYIGFLVYFFYGRRHSCLQDEARARFGPLVRDIQGFVLHVFAMAGLFLSLTAYRDWRLGAAAWRRGEVLHAHAETLHLIEKYNAHDILYLAGGFALLAVLGIYLVVMNKAKEEPNLP